MSQFILLPHIPTSLLATVRRPATLPRVGDWARRFRRRRGGGLVGTFLRAEGLGQLSGTCRLLFLAHHPDDLAAFLLSVPVQNDNAARGGLQKAHRIAAHQRLHVGHELLELDVGVGPSTLLGPEFVARGQTSHDGPYLGLHAGLQRLWVV